MRFLVILVTFALLACGGRMYHTVTQCGLTLRGSLETREQVPGFDIEMLEELERLTLKYGLGKCSDFNGYSVWVRPEVWDLYDDGNYRSGSAYCNWVAPRIEIAVTHPTTVAHELHHVAQKCEAPLPVDKDADASHADWHRSGAYKALDAIESEFMLYMIGRGPR